MHAHRANAPRKLVYEEIFGKVEYFIIHKYCESERMFTYIRKIVNMMKIIMGRYILINLVVINLLRSLV